MNAASPRISKSSSSLTSGLSSRSAPVCATTGEAKHATKPTKPRTAKNGASGRVLMPGNMRIGRPSGNAPIFRLRLGDVYYYSDTHAARAVDDRVPDVRRPDLPT